MGKETVAQPSPQPDLASNGRDVGLWLGSELSASGTKTVGST